MRVSAFLTGLTLVGISPAVFAVTTSVSVFTDTEFAIDNWSEDITFSRGVSRSYSVSQNTGGNPGNYRYFSHTYTSGSDPNGADIALWHTNNVFSFDPSMQGEIFDMQVSLDASVFSSPYSGAIGFGIFFEQNGQRFSLGLHQSQTPVVPNSNAILASQPGWHSFDFLNVANVLDNNAGFDISATGSEILFGIYTSNGTSNGSTSSSGGLDNFSVTIEHAPSPVPLSAAVWLFGSVIPGLLWLRRRPIS